MKISPLSTEVAEAVRLRDAAAAWKPDENCCLSGYRLSGDKPCKECGATWNQPCRRSGQTPPRQLECAAPQHVDLIERLFSELERLTACLQKANASHEHFEREWCLRGDEIERLHAELEQARAEFTAAVDAEPELPGDMPDEMWLSIRDDRDAATEAMRIVVRQTKCGIKARLSERP